MKPHVVYSRIESSVPMAEQSSTRAHMSSSTQKEDEIEKFDMKSACTHTKISFCKPVYVRESPRSDGIYNIAKQ